MEKKAFTLIELLVVIAIIALIGTLSLAAVKESRERSRITARLNDLKVLSKALEMYYQDNNSYPNSGGNWDGLYSCWGESTSNWIPGLVSQYIDKLPRDPRNHNNCSQQYIYKSNGNDYKLISHETEACSWIKNKYPDLIDSMRNCWAFGYWTPGAKNY